MVNKHYTVQKQQQNTFNTKNYSPPPVRSSKIISIAPNPTNAYSLDESTDFGELSDRRALRAFGDDRKPDKATTSSYGVNITLGNKMFNSHSKKQGSKGSREEQSQQQRALAKDHLEINDIGRFQYILQMDKEMQGAHPDKLYRIPSRIQMPASRQSSINSTNNHGHFWKEGSESPMTTPSPNSRRTEQIYRHLVEFWKYAKWPLLIILCAILLGTSIYFVVADSNRPSRIPLPENYTDIDVPSDNSIEANIVQEDNSTIEDNQGDKNWELKLTPDSSLEWSSSSETTEKTRATSTSSTTIRIQTKITHPTTTFRTITKYQQQATHSPITTITPTRNTKIIPIYTHSGIQFEEELKSTTELQKTNKESNVEPTRDTFDIIGFTSGHQNNFGIPIEEDERILRILNEELMKHEAEEANRTQKPTTDSSTHRTRVSPTLPVISHIYSTTERLLSVNSSDIGNCQSTSLSICRGILQYDLTINKSRKVLTSLEQEHFKYLFDSKCSRRAAEFVCSALEPECRPSQMGILRPCKRICKSILEPCASIIASSEVLTTTFDCDSYPDSSDRNVCEDPTRRGRCHDNEFKCLDSSCIPQQWKCDNIKDCSLGEDEENCLFCAHEEFRCQSNDKCIPDKWRCDQYNDCPDGSDEIDCYDYEDDSVSSDGESVNPREFAFASVQEPNSPKNKPYLTISADDGHLEGDTESYDDRFLPTAPDNESGASDPDREEEGETQKGEASAHILVGVPKSIANFQDSKEIMMTSDTENDFKYSKINQTVSSTTLRTDELTPGPSQCPEGELRCVSGECIGVEQICDKIVDCPDGADEAMCVYKETS